MIRWFLRLFPGFQVLESRLRDRDIQIIDLNNQIVNLKVRIALIEKDSAAEKALRLSDSQNMVDFFARRYYGKPVFGLASEIPVNIADHQPIERPKKQASDLVAEANRQFAEAIREMAEKNTAKRTEEPISVENAA